MPGRAIILRYITARSGGDQEVAGYRAGERERGDESPHWSCLRARAL